LKIREQIRLGEQNEREKVTLKSEKGTRKKLMLQSNVGRKTRQDIEEGRSEDK